MGGAINADVHSRDVVVGVRGRAGAAVEEYDAGYEVGDWGRDRVDNIREGTQLDPLDTAGVLVLSRGRELYSLANDLI